MRISTHVCVSICVCVYLQCTCIMHVRLCLYACKFFVQAYFYLSHASSTRVCTCSSFFHPPVLFFFFFGVLGHEGVSRKTRTLEQAEWKQLGSYYTSPRIARRLVAASSYVVHTYIHGLLRKNNVYSKHYSTYILEGAWRKRIRWHGQICHCHSEYRYLLYEQNKKRLREH